MARDPEDAIFTEWRRFPKNKPYCCTPYWEVLAQSPQFGLLRREDPKAHLGELSTRHLASMLSRSWKLRKDRLSQTKGNWRTVNTKREVGSRMRAEATKGSEHKNPNRDHSEATLQPIANASALSVHRGYVTWKRRPCGNSMASLRLGEKIRVFQSKSFPKVFFSLSLFNDGNFRCSSNHFGRWFNTEVNSGTKSCSKNGRREI